MIYYRLRYSCIIIKCLLHLLASDYLSSLLLLPNWTKCYGNIEFNAYSINKLTGVGTWYPALSITSSLSIFWESCVLT